ncbi:MAG TPA: hypothetical protein DHV04_05630 [Flavobacteriaceae bacterium]|jgi:hypothetical protein|nr:DUF4296 domain-containing protein [Flavobacteriaceae bacterium]HCZ10299.1 hypothetical protein [Flavobacteriaceae bacterium]|tara:strand:- start:513 stop:878 length:366 start_codon:yes stop_codon:yes gene_type:complete
MNSRILLLLLLLFFGACSEFGDNRPPDNLIPPAQMSDVMMDIILMKNIKRNGYADSAKAHLLVEQYLIDKYGIDSLQLASSQEYYAQNPKKYLTIFKETQRKLTHLKDSIQVEMNRDEDER